MSARSLVIVAALVALAVPFAAYGGWNKSSGPSLQEIADRYQIEQIEKIWHRATSKKSLDLMMTLWAPNSTMILGPSTFRGKSSIRGAFSNSKPFQKENRWISETPAYKTRVTVSGNKGTFYFECHYVDVATQKLTLWNGVSADLQKIKGRWLITKMVASTPPLVP